MALAVAGAIAALWITLRAHFLAYPGWLAVQKADFILGPIGVGLYWRHRRPENRFGWLLIVLGLLAVPYVLESSTNPTLFRIGVETENPLWLMIMIVILAFPSGRLDDLPERLIVACLIGLIALTTTVALTTTFFASHLGAGFSISDCRGLCPGDRVGAISGPLAWLLRNGLIAYPAAALSLATAGVIAWRFATGTPPRRRALAIGAPIALLFLLVEATRPLFQVAPGLALSAPPVQDVLRWADAATRSLVWYGFLFALIAAELFAGRVLRDVIGRSLGRPSLGELGGMLRGPLGDPGLRLGFWRPRTGEWVGRDGAVLGPPGPGQGLTEVDRAGRPAAAIVHDLQLAEDPELLQAAAAAALLAQENAQLEAAWKGSLRELADSRGRLASAAERERRTLERNLHDGAQQRLVAAAINLTLADEAGSTRERHDRIAASRTEIEEAMVELREIAHGIYPTALARSGLRRAFESLAGRSGGRVILTEANVGRFAPEIELAVYYCGTEAVQNASKHAGPKARVWIRVGVEADELRVEVRDDGTGFDVARASDGVGLRNMRDRLSAVSGHVDVTSEPGRGTLITVSAPVRRPSADPARRPESDAPAPRVRIGGFSVERGQTPVSAVMRPDLAPRVRAS